MKSLLPLLALICTPFWSNASAQNVDEIVNPLEEAAVLRFYGVDRVQALSVPSSSFRERLPEKPGLLIDSSAVPNAAYVEYLLEHPPLVPDFLSVDFLLEVFLPKSHPVQHIVLRLVDADGEEFQFRQEVPDAVTGWHKLKFSVEAENPKLNARLGESAHLNGTINMPVRILGYDMIYRDGVDQSTFGLGKLSSLILDRKSPVEISLQTGEGTPIHVLRNSDEKAFAVRVQNTGNYPVEGELRWGMRGGRDKSVEIGTSHVALGSGEVRDVKLSVPKNYGVYDLEFGFEMPDAQAVRRLEKKVRFAYMDPAGPTGRPAEGFLFGVCAHPGRYSREEQELEAMAASWCGVKVVREDIDWAKMQPQKEEWNFASFDFVVEVFGKYGISVMPIFGYNTHWAKSEQWKPIQPEFSSQFLPDSESWKSFISEFVKRYRGKIAYGEIWNEPDLYMFANFSEKEYVNLLEIAYDEIKKIAPEWQVFCGGFACLPGLSGAAGNPAVLPAVIASKKFDIFAFHGHGPFMSYHKQVEQFPNHGIKGPWYANETAISSMIYGEEVQAQTLFKKLIYSWAKGSLGFNWYDLRNDGADPANNEHNFGLVTHDFQPKPAYVAYNALASLYQGATFLRQIDVGDGSFAYLFKGADGRFLLAAWNESGDGCVLPLAVRHDDGAAFVFDLNGNGTQIMSKEGFLVFEIGKEPTTLQIAGQSGALEIEGLVVRLASDVVVTPGERKVIAFELFNPRTIAHKYAIEAILPPGLKVADSSVKREIEVPQKGTERIEFEVDAEAGFRSLAGRSNELRLKIDAMEFVYPVKSITLIPFEKYHTLPDYILDEGSQVTPLVPNSPETAHLFWKGTDDLSANVWLANESDTLLLRVEVRDDRHFQPFKGEDVWQGDGVQFAMKIPGQTDLWEIGLTRDDKGSGEVWVWKAPAGYDALQVAHNIRLATSRDESTRTTVYEARIPFSIVDLLEDGGKDGFLFNLLVNDNDSHGRESFIRIAPGIGDMKSFSNYPKVKLN